MAQKVRVCLACTRHHIPLPVLKKRTMKKKIPSLKQTSTSKFIHVEKHFSIVQTITTHTFDVVAMANIKNECM